MKHLIRYPTILIFSIVTLSTAADDNYSKVAIKTQKLTDNIYMLTGAGGNMGLFVGDDAAFLIDDDLAPLSQKIRDAVAKITSKPIKFVINTSWYPDHVSGNESFARNGAMIVGHENVRFRMSLEQTVEFFGKKVPPAPARALPVVTFQSDVSFHSAGDEILVFYLPNAHSDSDSFVHFRNSNVMHTGDVFYNKMYPFIDLANQGSIDGTLRAVSNLFSLTDDKTQIIPGHGPLAKAADLEAYGRMLSQVRERVRAMMKEGKTLKQIQAAKPTAEFDAVWGKGAVTPDKFVELVWMDAKRFPDLPPE
ncbi:MAG: MBL fold metallo-hydrolase [Sulfurifustis sp.]